MRKNLDINSKQKSNIIEFQSTPISMTDLEAHSNFRISQENWRCELETKDTTVGEFINIYKKMIGPEFKNIPNSACEEKDIDNETTLCHLSYSDCFDGRDYECGSTILAFELDTDNKIIESSFRCSSIP